MPSKRLEQVQQERDAASQEAATATAEAASAKAEAANAKAATASKQAATAKAQAKKEAATVTRLREVTPVKLLWHVVLFQSMAHLPESQQDVILSIV